MIQQKVCIQRNYLILFFKICRRRQMLAIWTHYSPKNSLRRLWSLILNGLALFGQKMLNPSVFDLQKYSIAQNKAEKNQKLEEQQDLKQKLRKINLMTI